MKFVIYSILVPNMVYWITYFVICEVFKMDSLVGAIVGSAVDGRNQRGQSRPRQKAV